MNEAPSILIVRLSSMGDIIHTLPAFAAVRRNTPHARIDWLIEDRYQGVLEEVERISEIIPLHRVTFRESDRLLRTVRYLRTKQYDLVIDFQGLMRSAVIGRLAGGKKFTGFSWSHVREQPAALLYSATITPERYGHVVFKNLLLADSSRTALAAVRFPWKPLVAEERHTPYAVIIPGASWAHKRWPPGSFGQLARNLKDQYGLHSFVTSGTREEQRSAELVVDISKGAAALYPRGSIHRLRILLEGASIVIGGDTGPLHLAWSLGKPAVGIFGPTDPIRNGIPGNTDSIVSRHDQCRCRYRRRCTQSVQCISTILPEEVMQKAGETLSLTAG